MKNIKIVSFVLLNILKSGLDSKKHQILKSQFVCSAHNWNGGMMALIQVSYYRLLV